MSLDNTSNNAGHSPDRRNADGEGFNQVIRCRHPIIPAGSSGCFATPNPAGFT